MQNLQVCMAKLLALSVCKLFIYISHKGVKGKTTSSYVYSWNVYLQGQKVRSLFASSFWDESRLQGDSSSFLPHEKSSCNPSLKQDSAVCYESFSAGSCAEGIQGKRVTTAAKRMVFVIVLIQKCTLLLSKLATSEWELEIKQCNWLPSTACIPLKVDLL